jgi:hypothetical protein
MTTHLPGIGLWSRLVPEIIYHRSRSGERTIGSVPYGVRRKNWGVWKLAIVL